jgi:hypothetical protein
VAKGWMAYFLESEKMEKIQWTKINSDSTILSACKGWERVENNILTFVRGIALNGHTWKILK